MVLGQRSKTSERVLGLLLVTDYTVAEAAHELELHRNTVDYHFRRAHRENKIHIYDWHRNVGVQGDWAAVYRLGEGVDKPQPKRTKKDAKVYQQRYHRKHRGLVKSRRAAKAGTLNPFKQLIQT